MQNEMPFFDMPEDALKASIQALGGAKQVAQKLWPDKTVENARDYLLACVNHDRAEKLSYSQIIFIFREAKRAGYIAGYEYWAHECEFDARPITKAEEVDRLTSVIEQSSKTLASAINTLERLQRTNNIKAAA